MTQMEGSRSKRQYLDLSFFGGVSTFKVFLQFQTNVFCQEVDVLYACRYKFISSSIPIHTKNEDSRKSELIQYCMYALIFV